MDDVDAAHAQAAQHMAESGDLITAKTNGIRYIEKPPLPYWLVAGMYKIFGQNTFATHLPNALAMLGLTWLAWLWGRRAWGDRAGFYAGLGVLTSVGCFLFTRFIIPEAILAFFLLIALYALIASLEDNRPALIYWAWAGVALALLTKGLIAPVFFCGAAIPYLLLTGQWRRWKALKPVTGMLLFLAIAAPWHIACGIINHDQGHPVGNHPTIGNVHGFFYQYFINEHVLRFFNLRYPHDYNKMPARLVLAGRIGVDFPVESVSAGGAGALAWKTRRSWLKHLRHDAGQTRWISIWTTRCARTWPRYVRRRQVSHADHLAAEPVHGVDAAVFLNLDEPGVLHVSGVAAAGHADCGRGGRYRGESRREGRQAGALDRVADGRASGVCGDRRGCLPRRSAWGLWTSRNLPFVADIGTLLAHRGVGDYTLVDVAPVRFDRRNHLRRCGCRRRWRRLRC